MLLSTHIFECTFSHNKLMTCLCLLYLIVFSHSYCNCKKSTFGGAATHCTRPNCKHKIIATPPYNYLKGRNVSWL